jgi:hypothetical protein
MSEEKQIEELGFIIRENSPLSTISSQNLAEVILGEGYRNQSKITNEIINEFKELTKTYLLNLDFYPVIFKNAILYAETNIRKKYTEDNK